MAIMPEGQDAPTLMLMGNTIALDMIADIANYVGHEGFDGFMEHINRRFPDGIDGEPVNPISIRINLQNLAGIIGDALDVG